MGYECVESWNLTSLVGAYLDLFLVAAAAMSFLASKLFPFHSILHSSLFMGFPFDSILHTCPSSSPLICRDDALSCCSLPPDPTAQEPLPLIAAIQDSIYVSAENIPGDPCCDSDSDGLGEKSEPGVSGVTACGDEANLDRMKSLEMQLEEQRRARAALYLDLENERNAAAGAVDEAVAMISRLQKENARIDLEGRQYRRMIEEKCAYDANEMLILKEIIVRTETERRVLEKEVQMYKQMLHHSESVHVAHELASDSDDQKSFLKDYNKLDILVDASSDDPLLMLKCLCESEGFAEDSIPILNPDSACSNNRDDRNQEFQEKSILLPTQGNLSSSDLLITTSICADNSVLSNDVNPPFEAEHLKRITDFTPKDEHESTDDSDNRSCTGESSRLKAGSSILDVHVIHHHQNSTDPEEVYSSCIDFDQRLELSMPRGCSETSNRISLIDNLSRRDSYFVC